ncbi:CDP-diacylglycerol--serine O-phosphatidyltransferase [Aminiphilus circumscriptus]|mgnify:CR=1 FL=1|jgi:CDP-diacylglycerol--serine O-phosphatidyltransferase|uniref:CDP-diacylglycerol--serine O-phosphatidyltransferase n=1 Tax=Aminiphilus circumscriptus TaxID=290732 RepID=UPI0004928D14|nr:CDP-diacylglycerol--serine O-phosphatidyltransferase [Aminiphilus circumscriptus]
MKKNRHVRGVPFTKIIPNMITSGNLLCGMLSLVMVIHGKFVPAAWLVFAAVFFDYMDGKMARSLGGSSAFGMELDSLADVVSFGVAPGLIVYGAYLHGFLGVTGALVAAFFALCGALRLARFNVMHVPGSFQGLPIPAGGLFVASFAMAEFSLPPLVMALITVGTAILMVSTVPYGNLKKLRKGNVNRMKVTFLTTFVAVLFITLREKAPLAGILLYVASGLLRFDWGAWLSLEVDGNAEVEHREG